MIEQRCIGCGMILQSDDKNKDGYVPEEKLISEGEILCQRCYKIKHYGKFIDTSLSEKEYYNEVKKALKHSDIVVAIVDIMDFEGSFNEMLLDYLRDYRSILVVNKIDLLPDFIHPTELSNWVKERLYEEEIIPDEIAFVSSKNRYGINGIVRKISSMFPKQKVNAVVIGMSNVGKSSIVNLLLDSNKITISKYSGTTAKSIKAKIPNTNISIIDTPGLIPKGRMSDLLEPKTGLELVPSNEISRKTYKLSKKEIFMIDIFARFRVIDIEEEDRKPSFTIYSSKNVKFHVTKEERINDLLRGNFFTIVKGKEKNQFLQNKWITKKIKLKENQDVSISGLGWINLKKVNCTIELTLPEYVNVNVRKSIFRPK